VRLTQGLVDAVQATAELAVLLEVPVYLLFRLRLRRGQPKLDRSERGIAITQEVAKRWYARTEGRFKDEG